MQINAVSKKQRKVLNWWHPKSPVKDAYGLIADGAIRSGKTLSMAVSFVEWAMATFDGQSFILAGKTVGSFRRNVLGGAYGLYAYWRKAGYTVEEKRTENKIVLTKYGRTNTFYIFGGRDESSQDLVQGVTAAGAFFDEVALMPESFVNQAMGRCSVPGAKQFFNCNPGGPSHWFKKNMLDIASDKNFLHLHFTMNDNPSLTAERRAYYFSLYKKNSVFYKRYILGEWVQAEGAIYDMLGPVNLYSDINKTKFALGADQPTHYIAIDYGTQNAFVMLHIMHKNGVYYVEREYHYSGKETGIQKTNSEYAQAYLEFTKGYEIFKTIIDPSAVSFRAELRQHGVRTTEADNDVLDGIRWTGTLLGLGKVRINKNNCPELMREMQGYVWDPKPTEKGNEKPLKRNDHGPDALRYFNKTVVKPREID